MPVFSFTDYGRRELFISSFVMAFLMTFFLYLGATRWPPLMGFAFLSLFLLVFVLFFFRDPERTIPQGPGILVSPADGRVTHIEETEDPGGLGERALRISIFLSIFDVHLNRAPCDATVLSTHYVKGDFVNAMRGDASHRNERNDLLLATDDPRLPRLLVRQIAGLIARRIVCAVHPGERLQRGERFGMIKFGSRTDLFLPASTPIALRVAVGDAVYAGATVIGELR